MFMRMLVLRGRRREGSREWRQSMVWGFNSLGHIVQYFMVKSMDNRIAQSAARHPQFNSGKPCENLTLNSNTLVTLKNIAVGTSTITRTHQNTCLELN